jgi:hypothetical protein
METVESVILGPTTSTVVRERLIDVLAAAAFMFHGPGEEGFQSTWKRVRPPHKPEGGIPFDMENPMFNVTVPGTHSPHVHSVRSLSLPGRRRDQDPILSEEDMRMISRECDIALRRARILKDALENAAPGSFRSDPIIKA